MDGKYGQLYTEQDVERILKYFKENDHAEVHQILEDVRERKVELTFPLEEPVFLLRAKDQAALDTLTDYQDNAEDVGAANSHIRNVSAAIADFERFQRDFSDRVKVPD